MAFSVTVLGHSTCQPIYRLSELMFNIQLNTGHFRDTIQWQSFGTASGLLTSS